MVRFLKVRKVANVTKTGKSTDPIDQPELSWITKSMHLPDFAHKKAPASLPGLPALSIQIFFHPVTMALYIMAMAEVALLPSP